MTEVANLTLGRDGPPDDPEHVTVELLNFPLQVFVQASQHNDELLREFALLALSPPADRPGHAVPRNLLDLIDKLAVRYPDVGDRTDAARDAAAARGEAAMDLTYEVSRSVGPAMQELHELMERADEFCREGQMLTVASTPLERDFRLWFLQEFTRQAGGMPPIPWRGPLDGDG
jgi:hypothetical protein